MVTIEEAEKQISEAEQQVSIRESQLKSQRESFLQQTKPKARTLERQIELQQTIGRGGVGTFFGEEKRAFALARQQALPQLKRAEEEISITKGEITTAKTELAEVKKRNIEIRKKNEEIRKNNEAIAARNRDIKSATKIFQRGISVAGETSSVKKLVQQLQAGQELEREIQQKQITLPLEERITKIPRITPVTQVIESRPPTKEQQLPLTVTEVEKPTGFGGLRELEFEVRGFKERLETKTLRGKGSAFERAGAFVAGTSIVLISAPERFFELGKGLVTDPVKTVSDIPGGFKQSLQEIGTGLQSPTPEFALGTVAGEVLLFKGVGKGLGKIKTKKPPTVKTDITIIETPKGVARTPFSTTFPEEFSIAKFETPDVLRVSAERVRAEKGVTFEFAPEVVRDIEFAKSIQRARLKSGADIIKVDEFGLSRIVEAPAEVRKTKPITFEIERPLVQRFDIVEAPKKVRIRKEPEPLTFDLTPEFKQQLRFDLKQPKRFDVIEPTKKVKIKKKPDGLTVDFTKEFKQQLKFELKQPKRFDVEEIGRGQQQILKPPKQIVKQKPLIIDLDKLDIIEGGIQKTRKIKKPRRLLTQLETPPQDLIGIPRAVGGAGLTEAQLRQFGIQTTAQQIQQIQKQSQRQLGFDGNQFQQVADLQGQKLGGFDAFGTQTKLLEQQRSLSKQLFIPLISQGEKQLSVLGVGDAIQFKPLQSFRQLQGIVQEPKLKSKQIAEQKFREGLLLDLNLAPLSTTSPRKITDFDRPRRKVKKVKKRKIRRTPIRPSFSGIVLGIEEAPTISPTLGVTPGQIRGLETGFDVPKRKKKTKKKVKKVKKVKQKKKK